MHGGTEWLIDAVGCAPDSLCEIASLRGICEAVIRDLQLKVVGEPHWYQFSDPGGVTGMYLLTESHLTCHTYPEAATATFNLYCCRRRPDWPWDEELRQRLAAEHVQIRQFQRGLEAGRNISIPATARGG